MENKSKVYFVELNEIEKIKNLVPEFHGAMGLKCHFGEEGNDAYVPAEHIKKIAQMLDFPPLLETTVLYRSPRSRASTHKELAIRHEFDFAEIDILDGEEGDASMEVNLEKMNADTNMEKAFLGENLQNYESLLVVSHFKGHELSGFGGAIKNLSMGLASRRGKLDMHAGVKHQVKQEKCTGCSACIQNCPVDAITLDENNKAYIDKEVCISCSKCISVCPVTAIGIPWSSIGLEEFQDRLAEYALAGTFNRQCYYINFLINIVPLCDCMGVKQERMTDDIGILVSNDPVAIDQASFDMVIKQCPEFEAHSSEAQLSHGEAIGLGKREYVIEKI